MMSVIGDSPSYHCGVISLERCGHRETRTRPALQIPAVPAAENARHGVDRRPAPARPTARAAHAHSPAAPLHHRALGSREGGVPALHQYSRGTFRLVARCATWIAGQHSTCSSILGSDAGESQRAPSTVTQSLPFILTCVALRKDVPSGVEGTMRPPAASSVTLRTSDG